MAYLKVYKASAGSGKTFTLALEYLKHLIRNPYAYRRILAVTFTNKATGEMKKRILLELNNLATGNNSPYLEAITRENEWPPEEIRKRAGLSLKLLLHDFSRFYVETIDRFFHRVTKSFAREIGLQTGFNIELDTSKVLRESVDTMLFQLPGEEVVKDWLVRFAESRIEEGKSWNFKNDILNTGQEIFSEKFKLFSKTLIDKLSDKQFLNDYLKKLFKIRSFFTDTLHAYGQEALERMQQFGLEISDFAYGTKGFANYFIKLSGKKDFKPGIRTRNAVNNLSAWSTKGSEKTEQIQQAYQEGLNRILAQSVSFYDSHIEDFKSAETIYGFIYTLGILTDIARHVNDYCKKNNLFLISDIAALLKEIIQGNDAPFVYEKTGNRFHYIMMDEFQDTSWMQWENFRPLLVNSLSENHDCMLVGDVKQSIYRWRNSDWKILAEQVNIDFGDPWIKEFHLDTNWRSRENIIRFNTVFFEKATAILESRYQDKLSEKDFGGEALRSFRGRITKAYEDIYQQIPPSGKKGGSVRIKFYDQADKDWKEQVKSKLYDSIQSVLDQGFGPDDIAILVRKTKEGREIIASLLSMEKDINDRDGRSFDIISNESLFLENSPAVQFILSVCKYLIYPWDRINSAFMLSEYRRISGSWGYTDDMNQLDFLCGEDQAFDEILRSSFPESFFRVIRYLPHLPLFEITEKIIQIFKLHSIEAEVPYIQAFQDTVIEYIRNETSDLHSFLEWWKTEGIKRTIAVSEYQNAIRVLTIHKAKGLEFPVVIIPFCYWNLDHSPQQSTVIWCSPEKKPFDALELLPVRYSPNLADTIFCKDYYSEMLHTYVDNLNLLYVAFTRAIDRLIVYAPTTGREKMTHAGDLLFDTIRNMASVETGNDQDLKAPVFSHYWQQEKREFIFGKDLKQDVKTEKSRIRSGKLKNYPSGTMKDRLRLRLHKTDYFEITDEEKKARISYGNIMHELFEHIVTRNDIDRAISKLTSQGKIQHDKAEELKMKVVEILTHPVAGEWFDEDWEVKTEAEILSGDEKVRRPDRVLIKNNRAVVIDYKFGTEEESHKQQLTGYMKNLKMMGYTEVKGYIWYVDFAKITEVLMKYES